MESSDDFHFCYGWECQFLILYPELLKSYPQSHVYTYFFKHFPFVGKLNRIEITSSITNFKVLGLWSLVQSELIFWIRLKIDQCLSSIFYTWISSFPQYRLCRRGYLFSNVCFWHVYQKSEGCNCMDLVLDLVFYSIGLHVCFCASTMLFMLLGLCSIIWSLVFGIFSIALFL
jgi:hypothetical protein